MYSNQLTLHTKITQVAIKGNFYEVHGDANVYNAPVTNVGDPAPSGKFNASLVLRLLIPDQHMIYLPL